MIPASTSLTGREAYERDLTQRPTYHDGSPRRSWSQLCAIAKWSWNRPTHRK